MSKAFFYKIYLAIIIAFFAINITYFNDISNDAALVVDYSKHIVTTGKPVVTLWGNLFGDSGYNFTYFPLFPLIVGLIAQLVGHEYVVIKIVSLFFYLCNIGILYFICCRFLPFWISSIIVLAYSLDPLIVNDTMSGLYGSFFGLVFLLVFLLLKRGREGKEILPKITSGILGGLSGITHLLGAVWIIMIFPFIKLFDLIFGTSRKMRTDYAFIISFVLLISLFGLWIFLDPEKRMAFNIQVMGNITDNHRYFPFHQSFLKALFNPIADFYLAIFKYCSFLPVFVCGILIYLTLKFKKNYFEFFFILLPLVSFIFLLRSQSYVAMLAPMIYAVLADICVDNKNRLTYKFFYYKSTKLILITAFIFYLITDISQFFCKPSLVFNNQYYVRFLENNTEKSVNIVTDPALFVSATEERRIYSVAALIYYWFRNFHSYEDIVKILSPEYIILTERMKRWGEAKDKFDQRRKFQKLLKEKFSLTDIVKNKQYGDTWIYKLKDQQ